MRVQKRIELPMSDNEYGELAIAIKKIGTLHRRDVTLYITPKHGAIGLSTDEPYDFISDAKNIYKRLDRGFTVTMNSFNKGQVIIKVDTVKPALPKFKASNVEVIIGLVHAVNKLGVMRETSDLKTFYKGLLDKYRDKK